jgi:hypothetical protein
MSTGRHLLQSTPFQPIFTHEGQAKTRKKPEKLFTKIQSEPASLPTSRFHAAIFYPTYFSASSREAAKGIGRDHPREPRKNRR